ncbi:hypothetical protein SlGVgp046 [Spodoptera litura granulovirus]|uniref:Odv-ec43 n=1 Tax=Spodoptera litura granulovirus TaxID=359919 RepID=A5IZP8_9BBAC|nr:hypothetical protein SlGVgp046 [Spodoptera litura granulovirus]ABQ51989.1 hypothetical protein SlGVgp046 [Spodoptera litura granulovirus]
MSCPFNIKVYISDAFVVFPYDMISTIPMDVGGSASVTDLTIYVPSYEDIAVINKDTIQRYGYTDIKVKKHVNHTDADKTPTRIIVYWNVISLITVTGVGVTKVFSVVLSDNLFECGQLNVLDTQGDLNCPLQIDYAFFPTESANRTILRGEYAGDSVEMAKALDPAYDNYVICFKKETPMGVKILNVKRYMILLNQRSKKAKFAIYLNCDELHIIQKELNWENTRRLLRGGKKSACKVYNRKSYNYIVDALEMLGIDNLDISSVHNLMDIFNPLVLTFKIVPDVFIQLNKMHSEKHVRVYCEGQSVAITNAGMVPFNLPTVNKHKFEHDTLLPPTEQFYFELGTRDVYVHVPAYNYYL